MPEPIGRGLHFGGSSFDGSDELGPPEWLTWGNSQSLALPNTPITDLRTGQLVKAHGLVGPNALVGGQNARRGRKWPVTWTLAIVAEFSNFGAFAGPLTVTARWIIGCGQASATILRPVVASGPPFPAQVIDVIDLPAEDIQGQIAIDTNNPLPVGATVAVSMFVAPRVYT